MKSGLFFRFALVLLTLVTSVDAWALEGPNVIRRIDVREGEQETVITVEGSATPTFTVFKLSDPVRLFVDIAGADVAQVDRTLEIGNGVLSQVGVLQFRNGESLVGRVIIAFAKPAAYDVRTRGNTVEIVIDGADRAPREMGLEALRAEYRALQDSLGSQKRALSALEAARTREEALSREAREARLSEERLRAEIEQARRKAEELKAEAEMSRAALLEQAELLDRAGQKAEERRRTLAEASRREGEKLSALAAEKARMEEATRAAAEAARLEEERRIAVEKATRLERERAEALRAARGAEEEKLAELAATRTREARMLEELREARRTEGLIAEQSRVEREAIEQLRAQIAAAQDAAEATRLEAEADRRQTEMLKTKLAAEADRVRLERAAVEATRRRVEQERAQVAAAEVEVRSLQERAAAHEEAAALALRKALEQEAAARRAAELASARDEARSMAAEKEAQEKAARRHAELLAAQEGTLRELAAKERSERARIAQLQSDREGTEAALRELAAAQKRQEELLAALQGKQAARAEESARLASSLETQRAEIEALQRTAASARSDLARLAEERQREESRIAELREELVALRRQQATVVGEAALEVQRKLEAKEAELASLKSRYERELAEARDTLAAQRSAVADKDREIAARERALESVSQKLSQKESEAEQGQRLIALLQQRLDALRGQREAAGSERAEDLAAQIEAREGQLSALRERATMAEKEIAALSAAKQRAEAEKELALSEKERQLAEREAQIETLRAQLASAKAGSAEARTLGARLEEKEAALVAARETLQALRASAADKERALIERERQVTTLQEQLAALRSSSDEAPKALAARLEEKESALAEARAAVEALRSTHADRDREVDELKEQLARLREHQERATGAVAEALREELDRKEAQLVEAQAALDRQRAADRAMSRDMAAKEGRLSELATRLAVKEDEVRDLESRLQDSGVADEETRRLQARLAASERKLAELAERHVPAAAADEAPGDRLARFLQEQAETIARLQARVEAPAAPTAVAVARPAALPTPSARVEDVRFREHDDLSSVIVGVKGRPRHEIVRVSPTRLVLLVHDAEIPRALERRLDTSEFEGPVRTVSSFRDPSNPGVVRVEVELDERAHHDISVEGDQLVWSFGVEASERDTRIAEASLAPRIEGRERPAPIRADPLGYGYHPERVGAAPPQADGGGGAAISAPGGPPKILKSPRAKAKRKYTGRRINLTIKDADIGDVLTFLAREGRVNIVASEEVRGKVSFHLEDIPWDLALDMILRAKGLDYVKEHGVYRVAPIEAIQKEFELALDKKKKITEMKQLIVKLITVNYADASDLSDRVKDILSEKGSVGVDRRTNTLIVKDIEDHVLAIEDLVRRLDTQTPQVLIEARIVEATANYSQEIGIQWGGNFGMSPVFGNQTGLAFPSIVGISGGADDQTSPSSGLYAGDAPNYMVNLPAAVGSGAGGAIGITLGSIGGAGNLNLRLSAAEEQGTVKIVSSPKISTLDNKEAVIQQGISIPISVVSAQGVNTQFFNADLQLRVTPHVTPDGNIALKIAITKNEPDFGQTGASGNPTIQKKEAHTELLLKDGDTTVIGGIYTRNTSESYKEVPLFAKIPILGWLFKSRKKVDKRTELLIFVTPRIVNRESAVIGG